MFLPVLLLFLAALAGAVVAYGTHPAWGQYRFGLDMVVFARHFQWPLAAFSIAMCLAVVAMVVAGKRRAWWLIGLGPVLALFVHRFATDPLRQFTIIDAPAFVTATEAGLKDEDWVVGVTFNNTAYAYPYGVLYHTPVVFQSDHDQRMVLIWSAFANRAMAYQIGRDLHARDVEIVSMPANALMLYNHKLGQFINGVTGRTTKGEKPAGFGAPMAVRKTTWRQWLAEHPRTRVMAIPLARGRIDVPHAPLRPVFGMPRVESDVPAEAFVAVIEMGAADKPLAVLMESGPLGPFNLTVGDVPLLVLRDPAGGRIRAFSRRIEDLTPQFKLNTDVRRKQAVMVDADSNSGWSADGRAIDGPMAREGKRLAAVPVDEGVYWGVVKTYLPDVRLLRSQ